MDRFSVYDNQELEGLLARLNQLALAELIVASAELRLPKPLDETGQKRFRQAMAGGQAITKIASYVYMLRQADRERSQLGGKIHSLVARSKVVSGDELVEAATAQVQAAFLSGLQEVTFHYYAICSTTILKLLPVAARAAGYRIPREHLEVLNSYTTLRDYFEHIDERLVGKSRQSESVVESVNEEEWRVVAGFEVDDQARIVINGKTIDVTSRGLAVIDELLAVSYLGIKQRCLEQVREHFEKHPELTPPSHLQLYKPFVTVFTGMEPDVR